MNRSLFCGGYHSHKQMYSYSARGVFARVQHKWIDVIDARNFFTALGRRIRELRQAHGYTLEDMISYGFSARHWQQIETGRPTTATTLLRICLIFKKTLCQLVRNLPGGVMISDPPRQETKPPPRSFCS